MTLSSGSLPASELKRRAVSLGGSKAFEMATQFLLPVVLARSLDAATFGEYRLLWLAIGTVMALAPLHMPSSLFYFLPRSPGPRKRLYVHQTLLFLAAGGLLAALAVGFWNPWLPAAIRPLEHYGLLVPLFIALWLPAHLLDVLPTVEERVGWQAGATMALALLRTMLVGCAAVFSADLGVILILLVAFALIKLGLLLGYVQRRFGLDGAWLEKRTFRDHLAQALPVGLFGITSGLRALADQWIVAALFTLQSFAAFSVASLLAPLITLCRQAVNNAFLPSMSRIQAAGDAKGMLALNSRANIMVGSLLYPALGFGFVFAEELITLVYTDAYVEAAPVTRVYIVGLAAMVLEMSTLVSLLRLGRFAALFNALTLPLWIAISWAGAQYIGLAGAAVGSVLGVYVDRVVILRRIAKETGVPFRAVQDWNALAALVGTTVLASALAWLLDRWWDAGEAIIHLCIGGAVIALTFAAGLKLRRLHPVQA